ncbi:hypothetical protein [Ancylobacter radicis]|uniref:Uncharacterized protein n=1 Tax=Ancylobacter radicis TaxID=2836179 RepID=A0ABS5R6T3_9HYPH|nr:hypothetical protein [Ancylobacter radicis]MBS9476082.1 hypothetical protein [Ancylobacter radicis]
MGNEVRALGQLVELRAMVDRRVMIMMIRALLVDASQEKLDVVASFIDLLRSQFESVVETSSDERTKTQARVALMHFEEWAMGLEQMLHEIRR